jgi:hypothetical protein
VTLLVVEAEPPNIEEIKKVFDVENRPVLFAWNDRIYNPKGVHISEYLMAHEAVHLHRQYGAPRTWWDRYIRDPQFRLEEEIEAHRAEYNSYCEHHKDRNARAVFLHHLATRLSGPLYGDLVDIFTARRAIAGKPK